MSKREKTLPKPPSTPFGKKKSFDENEKKGPLIADQMAMAMSEGKLKEFLKDNIPDSEYARKLAEMMMGMTGMMPPEGLSGSHTSGEKESPERKQSGIKTPDEVASAVQSGDVRSVMDILAREHAKRTGQSFKDSERGEKTADTRSPDGPTIDKGIIDELINIASDNGLSLDWLFLRALKRYVEEYKRTGNL